MNSSAIKSLVGFVLISVAAANGAKIKAPPPALTSEQLAGSAQAAEARGLKIVVSSSAPETVRSSAEAVLAAVSTQPLLRVLAGAHPPTQLTDADQLLKAKPEARAYDNLVVIGMPTDAFVEAVWQHQARPIGEPTNGFYIFGIGSVVGDIGYAEGDRNPFMHSVNIPRAPDETELLTLTGSTPAGVRLAVNAFLHQGLINGVVAGGGWRRPNTTILDRDPLSANFASPTVFPAKVGPATLIGLSMAGEDEYRGVLEDANVEPQAIWRAKYYVPGAWNGGGYQSALEDFSAGLQRRAYGNSIWAARFEGATEAAAAAGKIAGAAHLQKSHGEGVSTGKQPPLGPEAKSAGSLSLWHAGQWVFMSTLPYDFASQTGKSR